MSKKAIRKEKAVLELGPDGFSVHTIKLFYRLTKHGFKSLKNYFYETMNIRTKRRLIDTISTISNSHPLVMYDKTFQFE